LTYQSAGATLPPMTITSSPVQATIRHELRPGDLGAVTAMQGIEYGEQYAMDITFEADVARGMGAFGRAIAEDPESGRMWIAEDGGQMVGSIAVTDEGDGLARLRWFLVRRSARGQGLGRRLLDEAMAYIRERGFERVELETFSELTTAARMYLDAGFEVVDATPRLQWGREIELRHYELKL
jgi:GNAT superfamily N-acetyltransferase